MNYREVRQLTRSIVAPLLLMQLLCPANQLFSVSGVSGPDAGQLALGKFEYRDMDHGRQIGQSTLTIRKCSERDQYEFDSEANFDLDFSGFRTQRWTAVATSHFRPIAAALRFIRGSASFPSFELQYGDRVVNGELVRYNSNCPAGCRQPVKSSIPADTIDQRIDWAAVLTGVTAPGDSMQFSVYDPSSGVSAITARAIRSETIRISAGTFEATRIMYRMKKATGIETYYILASRSGPRVMLREEFPNGVVTELTRMVISHESTACIG